MWGARDGLIGECLADDLCCARVVFAFGLIQNLGGRGGGVEGGQGGGENVTSLYLGFITMQTPVLYSHPQLFQNL